MCESEENVTVVLSEYEKYLINHINELKTLTEKLKEVGNIFFKDNFWNHEIQMSPFELSSILNSNISVKDIEIITSSFGWSYSVSSKNWKIVGDEVDLAFIGQYVLFGNFAGEEKSYDIIRLEEDMYFWTSNLFEVCNSWERTTNAIKGNKKIS
jgi:hypothetical protein